MKTFIELLESTRESIDDIIHFYEGPDKPGIQLYEGVRDTLPVSAFPSLEIESNSVSNGWETTRAQRPNYTLEYKLTLVTENQDLAYEYIATLTTKIAEVLTLPQNLQLQVVNEGRWSPDGFLVETLILDSLVESASYASNAEGNIRQADFSQYVRIHEPFPQLFWGATGNSNSPTVIRPIKPAK